MQKTKLGLSAFFSLALIYLATSIALFMFELGNISKELPALLQSIDKVENKVDIEKIT